MHGRSPERPPGMTFDVFDKGTPALYGKALRRQVTGVFLRGQSGSEDGRCAVPARRRAETVAVLLCLNFSANSNTIDDPGLKAGEVWSRDKKKVPASSAGASEAEARNNSCPGFGRGGDLLRDIESDFPEALRTACGDVPEAWPNRGRRRDEWGAIGAHGLGD